jgi:hypothetical protein
LRPVQANSSQDPISKKPITKKGLVEWLKVEALNSTLSTRKTKKKIDCNCSSMAEGLLSKPGPGLDPQHHKQTTKKKIYHYFFMPCEYTTPILKQILRL